MLRAQLFTVAILLAVPTIADAGRLYWTDPTYRAVQYLNLGDLSVGTMVNDNLGNVTNARFVEGRVWWLDFQRHLIRRYRVSDGLLDILPLPNFGGSVESVGFTPMPTLGAIYWGVTVRIIPQSAIFEYSIWRSNLDGTNPEILLTRPGYLFGQVSVDPVRDRIYWRDNQSLTIWRGTLEGLDVQSFFVVPSASNFWYLTVDDTDGSIYFLAEGSGTRSIRRIKSDGMDMQTVVGPDNKIFLFELDRVHDRVYWARSDDSTLWRANIDGSAPSLYLNGASANTLTVDEISGVVYSISTYALRAVPAQGNSQTLLTSQCRDPRAISVNVPSGKVLWADDYVSGNTNDKAYSADLDGSNITGLGTSLQVSSGEGMIFDQNLSRVYFSQVVYEGNDHYACAIKAGLASGSNYLTAFMFYEESATGLCDFSLALDESAEKLYFAYGSTGRIYRANPFETTHELLLDLAPLHLNGLVVDAQTESYYWSGADLVNGGGVIGQALLGEDEAETLFAVPPSMGHPQGIAVDGRARLLYFSTDTGSIQRLDLDSLSLSEILAPGVALPADLAIAPEATAPQPAPPPHDIQKNRYVSFVPDNAGAAVAFQVTLASNDMQPGAVGEVGWVGVPNASGLAGIAGEPVYRDWIESVVHVGGCGVMPAGTFEIRAQSPGGLPTPAITVQTVAQPLPKSWGDVTGGFSGTAWTAPNGIMNITDILAELATIQGGPSAPHPSRTDLQSISITDSCVNRLVNAADVLMSVKAAQGDVFPFEVDPAACGVCP